MSTVVFGLSHVRGSGSVKETNLDCERKRKLYKIDPHCFEDLLNGDLPISSKLAEVLPGRSDRRLRLKLV